MVSTSQASIPWELFTRWISNEAAGVDVNATGPATAAPPSATGKVGDARIDSDHLALDLHRLLGQREVHHAVGFQRHDQLQVIGATVA